MSRLLKLSDICDATALSRPTLYRLIAAGDFPAPLKIGRASRWEADAVEAWIASRRGARAA